MTELPQPFPALLLQLMETPLLAITLSLAAYFAGRTLFRWLKQPLWCPVALLSASLLAATLALLSISYEDYRREAEWLTLLLGPATVALAVPLYQQLHHIRSAWRQILITLPVAASCAALYAVLLAIWLGASADVVASLAPKSVTAPIAIGIVDQLGGSVAMMMGGLLITGVVSVLFVELLAPRLNIRDERIIGFVLGINGHAIGTVRAFEISQLAGAFASLGMSLTGVFTAIWLPLVWTLLAF
ncbi:LrgB family protein [Marinobacterium jannaschii]|uniref:LrgB family protein n=1 Tax=Marinobacterium jannaschii TaxID=64970 RepID=UPI00056C72BD|nr:LrgB family protein [Marinobacterium jannaschii]